MQLRIHRITKTKLVLLALALLLAALVVFSPSAAAQGLVEYALILVLVAVVVIVILSLLGPAIGKVFCSITAGLGVPEIHQELNQDLMQLVPPVTATAESQFFQPFEPTLAAVNSNTPGHKLADNFFGLTTPTTEVIWWGIHGSNGEYCEKSSNQFTLEFFADENSKPGSLQASFDVDPLIEVERDLFDANGNPLGKLYRYSSVLAAPLDLPNGWLSIQSTGDEACLFSWSVASKKSTEPCGSASQTPPFIPAKPNTITGGQCLHQFSGVINDNFCYVLRLPTELFDVYEAKAQALNENFHLTSIHSAEENGFLSRLVNGPHFWIGLTDRDVEGTFVNIDGSPVDYTFWSEGEPNAIIPGDVVKIAEFGAWYTATQTDEAAAVFKAEVSGWDFSPDYNFAFSLQGSTSPGSVTGAGEGLGKEGAPLERDGISDIAQAVWIMRIANGDTWLSSADRALVMGSPGGGGYLGNEAILKHPDFLDSLSAVIENTYQTTAEVPAEFAAVALMDLLVYSISVDHLFWIERFQGTELGSLLDSIHTTNPLNSDAGLIVGGAADPDGDGRNNEAELDEAMAKGVYEAELVNLFIHNAERLDGIHDGGFEDLPPFPDLKSIGAMVSKMVLNPLEAYTLSARALNVGGLASPLSMLRFYLTDAKVVTTDDFELGSQPIPALGSGQSSEQSLPVNAPASPGSYRVGACVDPVAGETETGNQCSAAIQITVNPSDLVVINPDVDIATIVRNQPYTIYATASNQGLATAEPSTLRFYRSSGNVIDTTDTPLGSVAVGALSSGIGSEKNLGSTAPSTPGNYYVGACIDSVDSEFETDNQCSSAVPITVIASDLVVINPMVSTDTVNTTLPFNITVTVKNQGTATSEASTLQYYRSSDNVITTSDIPLDTKPVGTLAPNASSENVIISIAPGTPGTYYMGACIAPVASEAATSNQCSAGAVIEVVPF